MLNKMDKLREMDNNPSHNTRDYLDLRNEIEKDIRACVHDIVGYKIAMPHNRGETRTEYKRKIAQLENRIAKRYGYDMLELAQSTVMFLSRPIYTLKFTNGEKQ